ncbi:aromatic ring-hydroxylating dioxygenase subunit alpha [Nocardioides sp. KR10-350]|uniref:aromatic ring-hydroxylating oxygenase subunit alpha n=1 Tax=Nocardioides cheoyonin TaxID=3156615 RepID=UPI0032B48F8B
MTDILPESDTRVAPSRRTTASSARADWVPVGDLVERIREQAALPLEYATTLPAQTYVDPKFYELEVEKILTRDWHAVARVEQVPNVGDFVNVDLVGEPLVIVRGDDDKIRVLSRLCRHRYADVTADKLGNLPACGNLARFECPYHMWTYRLDGELINAVDMQRRTDFDQADYPLFEIRSEIWQGFIFVNLDDKTEIPLDMDSIAEYCGQYDMSEWEVVVTSDWGVLEAGWKIVVENFLEFYHHVGAHLATLEHMIPGLNAIVGDGSGSPRCYTGRVPLSSEGAVAEVDGHLQGPTLVPPPPHFDAFHRGAYIIYTRFPTMMVAPCPDLTVWLQLLPLSATSHRLLVHTLMHKSNIPEGGVTEELKAKAQGFFDPVQAEDCAINNRIQANMSSGRVGGGLFHDQEFPLLHMQRYLAMMLADVKSSAQ